MFSKAFRSVADSQMRHEEKSQTFSDEELDYLRCSQSCDITRSGTIAAAPVSPFAPIELQAQSTGYFNRFNFGQAMTRVRNTKKQNENSSNGSNSNYSNGEDATFFGNIEPLLNKSFESLKIDVLDNQVSSQFESVSDWNEVFITSKLTSNGNDNGNDNDNDNDNDTGIGLERRTRKEDGCMVKPRYYNENKSCTMAETPVYVLKSVYALCNDYYNGNDSSNGDGKDIECVLNEKEFEIHGMVFINNKGIKFVISVWHENEDNDDNNNNNSTLTRIEFLKLRGDSLVFEQFWYEMYELMHSELNFKEINSICTRCNSNDFKSLFTLPPLTDFDDNDNSDSNSNNSGYNYCMTNDYLDDLAMDLKEDYGEDGMDALLTLCEKLDTNSNVLFCRMVINNTMLVTFLIENTVCHCDIAYQRAALCVLNKIIILLNGNDKNECDKWISHLINESIILDQLILLLDKENQSKIVRKHSIRLLFNLLLLSKSRNKDNDKMKNKNVLNRKQFNCFQHIFKSLKVSKNIDCETKNMIDSLVGQLL